MFMMHESKMFLKSFQKIQQQKEVCGPSFFTFLSGFAALLTMCFPMIPMTVVFLQNKAKLGPVL
jgi:hypothetical protein